ncbi:hypothetical protein [uncultured Chryseobacterium sp.]|uniref:hypothetical protein n=1 Tax=uncultured Chryseobacterium sp. TaxID=259322 RepID=UPI0025F8E04F|nr:hypothetical protein [uncultured Chryseobacterium sp.]
MKINLKIFLCLSLLFIMNSCSIGMYFYVRNTTSESQKIVLTLPSRKNSTSFYHEEEGIFHKNVTLLSSKASSVKDFKKAEDKIKLDGHLEGENKIAVILPANSLTQIEMASNQYAYIIEMEYTKNNETVKLKQKEFINLSKFERLSAIFEID